MRKKKLLTVLLFCLSVTAVSWSAEVISIDLNGYNDANAYTGLAAGATAAAGENVWRAYYGGWGKPMGSARSANLADYNEPNKPGTYAAEVWIGDDGKNHYYHWGSGLMDDGFYKDPNATVDPCVVIFAVPHSPWTDGSAYGGTFDIYVYGNSAGDFNLTTPLFTDTNSVTGTVSGFVEGENYVVFRNVLIDDSNQATLRYSGELNAIQLVSKKQPTAIKNGKILYPGAYSVAYETNARTGAGSHEFGPDTNDVAVFYLDTGEYMIYDITADDVNAGWYRVRAKVTTPSGDDANLAVYIDNMYVGNLYYTLGTTTVPDWTENYVYFNILAGQREFKWWVGSQHYFNLYAFEFNRVGDVNMPDCATVYKYNQNYAGDYNGDCHVDANDLAYITNNWVECYSPDANECP
jgi:hypothetical protein